MRLKEMLNLNSGENVVLDALMLLGFFRVIPAVGRPHKVAGDSTDALEFLALRQI